MYVVKRDGRKEVVKFDKITARIKKLCYGLNALVVPEKVARLCFISISYCSFKPT